MIVTLYDLRIFFEIPNPEIQKFVDLIVDKIQYANSNVIIPLKGKVTVKYTGTIEGDQINTTPLNFMVKSANTNVSANCINLYVDFNEELLLRLPKEQQDKFKEVIKIKEQEILAFKEVLNLTTTHAKKTKALPPGGASEIKIYNAIAAYRGKLVTDLRIKRMINAMFK